MSLSRTPSREVRRYLRTEVGFGCPVPGCGHPLLTWHHFDPPWSVRQHHEPSGMVALCREHHGHADAGAFTDDQLREFKQRGRDRNAALGAKLSWMRQQLLVVVGGNFCLDPKIVLQVRNLPVVWFNRDSRGSLLLNVRIGPPITQAPVVIEDNYWLVHGAPIDIDAPPAGRRLSISHQDGDRLSLEYINLQSREAVEARYPDLGKTLGQPMLKDMPEIAEKLFPVTYPLTALELQLVDSARRLLVDPLHSPIPGISGCLSTDCAVAFHLQ